jgi:hypothetical protein
MSRAPRLFYPPHVAIDLAKCSPAAAAAWRQQSPAPRNRLADRARITADVAGVLMSQRLLDRGISPRGAAGAAAKMLHTVTRLLKRATDAQDRPLVALVHPVRAGHAVPFVEFVDDGEALHVPGMRIDLIEIASAVNAALVDLRPPLRAVSSDCSHQIQGG